MTASLVTAVVLSGAYYTPSEAQALLTQANQAYDRSDYAAAVEGYQKLVAHGGGTADVLYNLGTTELASGDIGQAVLYLERARRAGGRADDIDANLALARSKQLDQVVGAQADEPFLERLVNATPGPVVGWTFLALWGGAFVLLILMKLIRGGPRGLMAGAVALLLLGAAPTGGLLALHAYAQENLVDGVIVAKTLPARELPQENAKVSFEVHAGLKVRVLDTSGAFLRIRLPNGLEGWTDKSGLAEI